MQMGKFTVVIFTDDGMFHALAKDYDLDRVKKLADSIQAGTRNQVKVFEATKHGYRVAYTSHNYPKVTK